MKECELCKIEIEGEYRFCEGCIDYLGLNQDTQKSSKEGK